MRIISTLEELEMPSNHKAYLENLLRYFRTCAKVENVFLFGSCAKGTATQKSDIDLFVVGSEMTDEDEFDIAWGCPRWEGAAHIPCDILSGTHEKYTEMSKVPGMIQYSIELRGADISGLLQPR